MASFIRGKQAGIQNDLSAGLTPEHVAIDDVRFSPAKADHKLPDPCTFVVTLMH